MSAYLPPYAEAYFKGASKRVHYCYPDRLLRDIDVFPLFVLDGGAFFSTNERLGGATGGHFMRALEDGTLLRDWRVGNRIVWDRVYDRTLKSPCQTLIEQHVWLNRLYFLLPIAQRFFRTRDESWAQRWYGYFSEWVEANPYVDRHSADARLRTKYTWFDMQITWRLLVMIHSVKLFCDSKALKRKHWHAIYDAIDLHSRCLYREANRALEKNTGHGNHFLQHGVALIYTGSLFPRLPGADAFIATGRAIVRQQLDNEILPDGGSIEGSPSYSHFIARLYLDAYLLLRDNKLPGVMGLERGIKRQYRQLESLATPTGRTLQVSDSYAMDVRHDLQVVRELFPLPEVNTKRSVCFPDSQMAVLRNGRVSVYIDAMPDASHHIHAGKPNLLIFVGDEPLLIDSGCSSYDRELWDDWYRSEAAHNVVAVQSTLGSKRTMRADASSPEVKIKRYTPKRIVTEHHFKANGFSYTWTRTVSLSERAVTVHDRVRATSTAKVSQFWHLSPVNAVLSRDGRSAVLQLRGGDAVVDQASGHGGGAFKLSHRPAIDPENRVCVANRLASSARGRQVEMKVRFKLPK